MNSVLSNDSRLSSLEVTDYLKIPTCSEIEFKKNLGREGELKYNTTSKCLMIRCSDEWRKIILKPYETGFLDEEKKPMKMTIVKKTILAEFVEILEPLIKQQIEFLLNEANRLKIKKIIVNKRNADKVSNYLQELNIKFKTDETGEITIDL